VFQRIPKEPMKPNYLASLLPAALMLASVVCNSKQEAADNKCSSADDD